MDQYSIQVVSEGADFVSLSQAREHLVIDDGCNDLELKTMIGSARRWAEKYTGRFFSTTEIQMARNGFSDCIHLPHKPVSEIVSVVYDTEEAQDQTLASENYELDARHSLLRAAYGVTLPAARCHWNSVRINYRVGYEDVPNDVVSACLLVIGSLFANRESQQAVQLYENKEAKALLNRYVVWR